MTGKNRILLSLLTGLALGTATGFVEALALVVRMDAYADSGNLFIVNVVLWGLIGMASGPVSCFYNSSRILHAEQVSTVLTIRILGMLLLIETGSQAYFRFIPAIVSRQNVSFCVMALLFIIFIWYGSHRIVVLKPAVILFSKISKAWLVIAALSLAFSIIAGAAGNSIRHVHLQKFKQPAPPSEQKSTRAPRVMLIGLDSATWEILLPLAKNGSIPSLRSLMERGTWGVLKSSEISKSPVVWTTIMTGKPAEEHGITDMHFASATNRKTKAVWQIATEQGLTCSVINVPGTYPILDDCAVMLSGFPVPDSGCQCGWLLTTGEKAVVNTNVMSVVLDCDPASIAPDKSWESKISLSVGALPWRETTPGIFLYRLSETFSRGLNRFLVPVNFGTIKIVVGNKHLTHGFVVEGSGEEGNRLFRLTPGEWSKWLVADINGRKYSFKVHYLQTEKKEVSLYVTPFYPFPDASTARPASWVKQTLQAPYVVEGVGWKIFLENRLIETLDQHLTDVAVDRSAEGLLVLDSFDIDLFTYIITLTDRIQHPMLKFMMPEEYRKLAESLGGKYAQFKPTADQIEKYGEVINKTYMQADTWIGRFLERADLNTTVIIVSDHGASPGRYPLVPTAGCHHPNGMYIVANTARKSRAPDRVSSLSESKGPDLVLEDITPIILHSLGLPAAKDMKGRLPQFLLANSKGKPKAIDTYEEPNRNRTRPVEVDETVKKQLRSLGYIK